MEGHFSTNGMNSFETDYNEKTAISTSNHVHIVSDAASNSNLWASRG